MSNEKHTPDSNYEVNYDDGSDTFIVHGPAKPHHTGGTVRDIVSTFEDEGHALEVSKELNALLAEIEGVKTQAGKAQQELGDILDNEREENAQLRADLSKALEAMRDFTQYAKLVTSTLADGIPLEKDDPIHNAGKMIIKKYAASAPTVGTIEKEAVTKEELIRLLKDVRWCKFHRETWKAMQQLIDSKLNKLNEPNAG